MTLNNWISAHYEEQGMAIKWVAFSLELIAGITLLLLMFITCTDVVGRYLFNNSLDAASELTEIGIAIIVFAEMPIITWRGGHVVVDMLDNFLGGTIVKVLGVLSILVISSSLYYLAAKIFFLGARSIRRSEASEFLAIPMGYVVQYIAIMSWVTAATVISYGTYHLLKKTKSTTNKEA
ncbi:MULTISPECIES: TRAP transporter small permease [Psychromonas]|uniref:TRAP transporter small permease n=1 Tax=Psychromonas TaxID=67572 RepID=UPI0003FD5A09|nr:MULTISPECIES: TRAP transporter small permease [Psychromonas]MBB1274624.1 TRAP transporter small permease [Psychromonas sp. SR45-3]